jgi:hypothetical protein
MPSLGGVRYWHREDGWGVIDCRYFGMNAAVSQQFTSHTRGDEGRLGGRGALFTRRASLVLAVAGLCVLTGCGSSERSDAITTTPTTDTPKYSIIGTSGKRYDGEPIYFVLIDPVDLSNDAFKQDVKSVLQAVAHADGSPKFSAQIFDDEALAREAFSEETSPPSNQSPEVIKAAQERRGQHLVAMYAGGLITGLGYPYDISWYPAAFNYMPNVGRYVDSEKWKPQQ